ncbi:MAG: hypothetical protein HC797_02215 [Anaerolineales bacterium]|nr:hypothetical protein [Anaerolineales bacterium]
MRTELILKFSNLNFDSPSAQENEGGGEVCIANISPKERKKRLNFAIGQFVLAILILAILFFLDVNPLWRLPLFFMFAASATSFFQWRDKT